MARRKPTTKEPTPRSKPDGPPAKPRRAPQRKQPAPARTKAKAKATQKSSAPRKRKPKPTGRPSKITQHVRVLVANGKKGKAETHVLTVGEAFVAVLETGCSIETAASTVGISRQTVYDWLARAEEWRDAESVPAGERPYLDFSDAVTRTRETVVTIALAGILEAGKADWRAWAWFLERSRPDEFGRATKIDLGGSDGKGGRMTLAELMASASADPSTASDEQDPDLSS